MTSVNTDCLFLPSQVSASDSLFLSCVGWDSSAGEQWGGGIFFSFVKLIRAVGFCRTLTSIPGLLSLDQECLSDLLSCFFCARGQDRVIFLLPAGMLVFTDLQMLNHLCPWDESHLVTVWDPSYVFLDLIRGSSVGHVCMRRPGLQDPFLAASYGVWWQPPSTCPWGRRSQAPRPCRPPLLLVLGLFVAHV